MAAVSVQRLDWRQWSEFAPTWERIHNLCPDASFFLTREWVDCWLAIFGESLKPELLAFAIGDDVVACCLLVWRTQWVRGIPLRRVYLNCAGEDEADSTCIEYNSLLSLPGCAEPVAQALAGFLRSRYWDELVLPGMAEPCPICIGRDETSVRLSHYVDLCRVRSDAAAFDSVLSSNARHQIRRSQRLYEQSSGPCTLRVARTVQEAAGIFTRLADLHQAAWQGRGRPGVFASPRFTDFHRKLIQAVFDRDRILLVEVCAGTEAVGALYSFLYRGKVYFYQSGFRYSDDARMKPGLLAHYLAIRHCLEQPGLKEYDFLAGDSQYKRSLATASRALQWIVVRRPTPPALFFRGLRWAKRTYVQILEKGRRRT